MSFKTSVLIWFSRFRGTAPPQANGVGLLYKTEVHGFRDINIVALVLKTEWKKNIFFNDIGLEDMVTYEHRGMVTWGLDRREEELIFQ